MFNFYWRGGRCEVGVASKIEQAHESKGGSCKDWFSRLASRYEGIST